MEPPSDRSGTSARDDGAVPRLPKPPRWTPIPEDRDRGRCTEGGSARTARARPRAAGSPAATRPAQGTDSSEGLDPRRLGPIETPRLAVRSERRSRKRPRLAASLAVAGLALGMVSMVTIDRGSVVVPGPNVADWLLLLPAPAILPRVPLEPVDIVDPQPPAPLLEHRFGSPDESAVLAERAQALQADVARLEAERQRLSADIEADRARHDELLTEMDLPRDPPIAAPSPTGNPAAAEQPQDRSIPERIPAHRVFIHFTAGHSDAERRAVILARALEEADIAVAGLRPVGFDVRRDAVRYFFDDDQRRADLVRELAGQVGGQAEFTLQDFTHYRPPPRPGTVELWVDGAGAS